MCLWGDPWYPIGGILSRGCFFSFCHPALLSIPLCMPTCPRCLTPPAPAGVVIGAGSTCWEG